MKVFIDRENCVSCGSCWEACPDLFEQDPDDSFSRIIEKHRTDPKNRAEGTVPPEDEACAKDAADLCPSAIIRVE